MIMHLNGIFSPVGYIRGLPSTKPSTGLGFIETFFMGITRLTNFILTVLLYIL